jgi:hypothetical protein
LDVKFGWSKISQLAVVVLVVVLEAKVKKLVGVEDGIYL